jgi:hypothetical protein
VTGGTRTLDHRDHNPGLYQLSYGHRDGLTIAETEAKATELRCYARRGRL